MRRLITVICLLALMVVLGTACKAEEEPAYTVTLIADGRQRTFDFPQVMTVSDVLRRADITLNERDRVNPPDFTLITDGMTITVVRVSEDVIIEQVTIPFERRTTRNDSIPTGQTRLLQAGVNGLAEVTYRVTYEDGVEVARNELRRVVIEAPQDEVVMVGSGGELPSVTINGTITYISGGNAWIMRQNSVNRRPLTTNGGLDGRVFAVSADGNMLLFTRQAGTAAEQVGPSRTPPSTPRTPTPAPTPTPPAGQEAGPFNSLWVIFDTTDPTSRPVRLNADNILYAEWAPGYEQTIVYSTAEPRPSFPGWQANNDLWRARVSANGALTGRRRLLESSSGGVYGWYGSTYAFGPDGITIAWAQPDGVGLLMPLEGQSPKPEMTIEPPSPQDETALESEKALPSAYARRSLLSFPPLNAYDFVWVPSVSWSPDGALIATNTHGPPIGAEAPEDSPVFNVSIFALEGNYTVDVVREAGMWAAPQFSPFQTDDEGDSVGWLAYLKAVDPLNSIASRYRLVIADRDGSNARIIFPSEDAPGLSPQTVAWSPDARQIALIYQGDLYVVDIASGATQQLSSDGLSSSPRWTP
jgi:hypothetical protein